MAYEYIFEAAVPYYLWLLTLTLTLSSALLLAKFSLRIKKTIIGKTTFFVSLSFILWSGATASAALMHMQEINVYVVIYTLMASLASLVAILAVYYGMIIQKLLVPDAVREVKPKLPSVALSVLAFTVGFVGFIRFFLNNPNLNAMMEGMSIMTALGFMLLAVSLITLSRPKVSGSILYAGGGLTIIIAFTALIGHRLGIPILYAPLPGGGLSVSTAMGFIGASIWIILAKRQGLRSKISRFVFAVFVLIVAILALLGYLLNSPILYASSSYARLSIPTAIDFILIGLALFWRTWKML